MTRVTRPFAGILLALVLVLTGQSMAMARGAPGPAGEMVICTGQGIVSITVDENGDPVGPPHICPDCALSLFAAIGAAQAGAIPPATRLVAVLVPDLVTYLAQADVAAQARGPPART